MLLVQVGVVTNMSTEQPTQLEISQISALLKQGALCTPVFIKTRFARDNEFGNSGGTLSLVGQEGRVFAVTAEHVIADTSSDLLYSPVLPGWHQRKLIDLDWGMARIPDDSSLPKAEIDLAYAELSKSQIAEIEPKRILPLWPATDIENPFIAVMSGYLNKKHSRTAIKQRGRARPNSYALVSEGIKQTIRPPRSEPDTPVHITFPFDRKNALMWEDSTLIENKSQVPQLNGLSGGPIVFCGNRNPDQRDAPGYAAIGFLISQSDKEGKVTAVTSDVIFRAAGPYAKS